MFSWLVPLADRWYAFLPWLAAVLLVWRGFGWRRALAWAGGSWLVVFAAEWASSGGPVGPFGPYAYRAAGLVHDWRLAGVPVFDSLSFSWLALGGFTLAGWLGARGWRRVLLTALAMVAVDLVVDPVALRGRHWLLGSIYSYPAHQGVWFGVTALNYLGWLVVGLVLGSWTRLWLGDFPPRRGSLLAVAALLLGGTMVLISGLAVALGIWPAAAASLLGLALVGAASRLGTIGPLSLADPELVIACALASEARAVRDGISSGWLRLRGPGPARWVSRRLPVQVWETGLGPAAAHRSARQRPPGALVLVAGVAGATGPGWQLGDVAIGTRVLGPADSWLGLSPGSTRILLDQGLGRAAALGTMAEVTDAPELRQTVSRSGVELVEMETAAWATERPGPGARTAALRVVLDTPEAPLGAAAGMIPPGGTGPDIGRVAVLLIRRPRALAELLRLGGRQRVCLGVLGQSVAQAVQLLSPGEPPAAMAASSSEG